MSATERLDRADAVRRLVQRDAALFSDDAAVRALVADRLGWICLTVHDGRVVRDAAALARELLEGGVTDAVLLGMGGSSLASVVLSRALAPLAPGGVTLHVLDTTCPETVLEVLEGTQPARTVVLVASKSGGTVEPNSLYSIFRERYDEVLGQDNAGNMFIALTDPGSSLERLAGDSGFRAVVHTPADIGGRYSALTAFHLLPAALLGLDLDELMRRAASMEEACSGTACDSPGATLASFIADGAESGRDKLVIVTSPGLESFGLWAEQLVAESLGKLGRGVLPVPALDANSLTGAWPDRAVAIVRLEDDDTTRESVASAAAESGAPLADLVLADPYDLAAEFVRWEYAVALAGFLLGVNPFDEPNVTEAKGATSAILDRSLPVPVPLVSTPACAELAVSDLVLPEDDPLPLEMALGTVLGALEQNDYLALLAYVPERPSLLDPLREALASAGRATGAAVTLELGPRYLHSTGQLHKGGPAGGVFVVLTGRTGEDLQIPERDFSLRDLFSAQATGDLTTLARHGRRALWVAMPDTSEKSVESFSRALAVAASEY
jgi:transaldolase / glucose-6-phosphate isomerase